MTITCGIQIGIVTMAMKVLHNSCNKYSCDFPDMYALSAQSLGIPIKQVRHFCVTTITYTA